MPAAAVIPAPKGYINVVAVKKLVVEFRGGFLRFALIGAIRFWWSRLPFCGLTPGLVVYSVGSGATQSLRANWGAQSRLDSFEHFSLE